MGWIKGIKENASAAVLAGVTLLPVSCEKPNPAASHYSIKYGATTYMIDLNASEKDIVNQLVHADSSRADIEQAEAMLRENIPRLPGFKDKLSGVLEALIALPRLTSYTLYDKNNTPYPIDVEQSPRAIAQNLVNRTGSRADARALLERSKNGPDMRFPSGKTATETFQSALKLIDETPSMRPQQGQSPGR